MRADDNITIINKFMFCEVKSCMFVRKKSPPLRRFNFKWDLYHNIESREKYAQIKHIHNSSKQMWLYYCDYIIDYMINFILTVIILFLQTVIFVCLSIDWHIFLGEMFP